MAGIGLDRHYGEGDMALQGQGHEKNKIHTFSSSACAEAFAPVGEYLGGTYIAAGVCRCS
jgi:hypothetical protein